MTEKKSRQKTSPKIIVIVGPTAVGKSDYAVKLAKKLSSKKNSENTGAEIISADSRQVYVGLDIGTGKITRKEMRGVQHHLLDIANPRKQFDVEKYRTLANKAIVDIIARNRTPIIVGGTGFYIDTLVHNAQLPNVRANPALRKKLANKTASELFSILRKLDSKRAKIIARNNSEMQNTHRLIRAIEIATELGSVPKLKSTTNSPFDIQWIGLTASPEILRKRIHTRLLKRLKSGMIQEVKNLHHNGLSWKRMEELGLEYRYISRYLRGILTLEEMTTKLDIEIWHYAKRQLGWFKRNKKIHWISVKK